MSRVIPEENTRALTSSRAATPRFPSKQMGNIVERIFILFDDAGGSIAGRCVAVIVMTTIVLSTISFVVETMPEVRTVPQSCNRNAPTITDCEPRAGPIFQEIEVVCIVVFTIDYLVRMISVPFVRPTLALGPKAGCNPPCTVLRKYALQPLNIIDLLAIAPFYVEQAIGGNGSDLAVIRVLRLARVLRIFKMGKHNKGMKMLATVLSMSAPAMQILTFFSLLLVVLFASLFYFAEGTTYSVASAFTNQTLAEMQNKPFFAHGTYVRQDLTGYSEEPTPVRSIPQGFWWVAVTMTTVGYGDVAPTTSTGKVLGVVLFYVGIIFLALPITILGTNFEVVYSQLYAPGEVVGGDVIIESQTKGEARAIDEQAKDARAAVKARRRSIMLENEKEWSNVQQERQREARRNSLAIADFLETPWIPRESGVLRTCFVLFEDPSASRLGKFISILVFFVIVVSCTTFCMETVPSLRKIPAACQSATIPVANLAPESCEPVAISIFEKLESAFIVIFTIEYLARVLTVHAVPAKLAGVDHARGACSLMWKYCTQPLNMVDLIAIIPWYISKFTNSSGGGVAVLRVLRLVRVFRLFKVGKYATGAHMVLKCITQSLPALSVLFFLSLLTCVLFGSCMYFAEGTTYSVEQRWLTQYPTGVYVRPTIDGHDIEPSPFRSIPSSFWWFFTTTTTVGYGDFVPTTAGGKCVGVLAFFAGIILLALPVTIIGGNFSLLYSKWMQELPGAKPRQSRSNRLPTFNASGEQTFGGVGISQLLAGRNPKLSAPEQHARRLAARAAVKTLSDAWHLGEG